MISSRTTNIRIELWDDDGGLRFGEDHVDVTSSEGRNLDLTLDLDSCSINGSVSGSCGATIVSSGTSDDRARIHFQVNVVPCG